MPMALPFKSKFFASTVHLPLGWLVLTSLQSVLGVDLLEAQTPDEALQLAVEDCDLDAVKEALAEGADLSQFTEAGESLLQAVWTKAGVEQDMNKDNSLLCERVFSYLVVQPSLDVNLQNWAGATALATVTRIKWAVPKVSFLTEAVQELLKRKANPNIRDQEGNSPLNNIFYSNHILAGQRLELLDLLLAAGADPNLPDGEGKAALHAAALCWEPYKEFQRRGNLDVALGKLLAAGADVNVVDGARRTPLNIVAGYLWEDVTATQLLLDAGADVNLVDRDFYSPLHHAARNAAPNVAKLLLRANPDVNARSKTGRTALWLAADGNHTALEAEQVCELLLKEKAQVDLADEDGDAPIHRAALGCKQGVVKILLAAGSEVDLRNKAGRTALHEVAKLRRMTTHHLPELLVEHGFNISLQDKAGRTPLHILLKVRKPLGTRHVLVLSRLLGLGASPDIPDKNGRTALHYTAKFWSTSKRKFARLLQERRPYGPDKIGHLFEQKENEKELEVLNRLLDWKVEVNAKDKDGNTPLLFLLHGNIKPKLYQAVQSLIIAGSDIEMRNKAGRTAVGVAAYSGLNGALSLLLRSGADFNVRDKKGQAPLLLASTPEGIRMLLDEGVDIDQIDEAGSTALMTNVIADRLENVEILLARGVDMFVKNKYGETAHDLAARSRYWQAAAIRVWLGKAGWTRLHYATAFCLEESVRLALLVDPQLFYKRTQDSNETAKQIARQNRQLCGVVYRFLVEFQATIPKEEVHEEIDHEAKVAAAKAKALRERYEKLDAVDSRTGQAVLVLAIGTVGIETFILHYKYLCMQSEISRFVPGLMFAVGSLVATQIAVSRSASVSCLGYIGFVAGMLALALAFRASPGSKLEISLQRWKRKDLWSVWVTLLTLAMCVCIFLRETLGDEPSLINAVAVCLVALAAGIGLLRRGNFARSLHWALHSVGALVLVIMILVNALQTSNARPATAFFVTALFIGCFVDYVGHFGKEREHKQKLELRQLHQLQREANAATAAITTDAGEGGVVDIEMSVTTSARTRALEPPPTAMS